MENKILTLLFAIMASTGSLFAQITIDGDFSDWDQVPAAQLAEASSSTSENFFNIKFCVDDGNIYYYMEYIGMGAFDMYLNTDGDASTGSTSGIGADYIVDAWFEDGMPYPGLFQHNGSDQEAWDLSEVSGADMANSDPVVLGNGHSAFEGSIALLSFPTPVTSLQVLVSAMDEGWSPLGDLPDDWSVLEVPMGEVQIPTSGSCGEDLTWNLSEGVLTISGTGAMTSMPWALSKNDIQTIVMGEGITEIMANAFSGCANLTTVNIPSSVVTVGDNAFNGCTSLPVIDGIRYADTYLVEAADKTLSSYTIQETTKWIAANAFYGCHLMSITVPDGVSAIGILAFYGIANVNYNGTAEGEPWGASVRNGYVDGWLVYDSPAKNIVRHCSPDATGEIVLPQGLWGIDFGAFNECAGITNINIPNTVHYIGYNAFYGCSGLPVEDGLRYADSYLVEVVDYDRLSYTVREGTKWIGDNVFAWMQLMEEINLPESLKEIGEGAFYQCYSLTSITIPANVQTIGAGAFSGCTGLGYIRCEAQTPPVLGNFGYGVFSNVDKTIPLYVPEASIEAYQNADQWSEFTNISAMRIFYYVRFVDWNGTVIDVQDIDEGQAAVAPADPVREGYTFIGWDRTFDNITEHITVTAQYVINYDVFFLSHDGQLLKQEAVPANTAATAPAAPERDGYVFTGWSGELAQVNARTFAVAQYEPEAPVYNSTLTYEDKDGGIINTENITLTLPVPPMYDGFTFIGWMALPEDVANGIVIRAVYQDNSDPTPVDQIAAPDASQKVIRDGNVYILRGDRLYTLTGQEVK